MQNKQQIFQYLHGHISQPFRGCKGGFSEPVAQAYHSRSAVAATGGKPCPGTFPHPLPEQRYPVRPSTENRQRLDTWQQNHNLTHISGFENAISESRAETAGDGFLSAIRLGAFMTTEPPECIRHAYAPDAGATAETAGIGAIGPPPRHAGFPERTRPIGIFVALASLSLHTQVMFAAAADGRQTPALEDPQVISARERVSLRGDVPGAAFPDIQAKADRIWRRIASRLHLGADHPPPSVHFHPFDRKAQPDAWTGWQKDWLRSHPLIWSDWKALVGSTGSDEVSPDWIDSEIDRVMPFPSSFLAFHYTDTNQIQMNPSRTFRASLRFDQQGQLYDSDGRGYYSMAHEMVHYGLELKGIVSTKLHHCLMLYTSGESEERSLMEAVAGFLVESEIIAISAGILGLRNERLFAPCSELTAEERHQVERDHAWIQRRP